MNNWHKYFMELAMLTARKSPDNSMGVGCIIVGPDNEIRSTGYNGFPRGIEYNDERRERPAKYAWTEHAERNALYNAARIGVSTKGCKAYVVCTDRKRGGGAPCADCCRGLIQAGITEIVEMDVPAPDEQDERPWTQTVAVSIEMMREAGVVHTMLNDDYTVAVSYNKKA